MNAFQRAIKATEVQEKVELQPEGLISHSSKPSNGSTSYSMTHTPLDVLPAHNWQKSTNSKRAVYL